VKSVKVSAEEDAGKQDWQGVLETLRKG